MSQSTRRFVGDYIVGKKLGSGSFSVVWHGKHKYSGTDVAIKEIITERLNKKLHESLMSEITILKHIDHPNIIRLHDIIEEPDRVHLILEYCKGGDLFMYIQQCQGKISEGTAKRFMQHLASGLHILHQNNLIHRDLKPQNLLLSTNSETAILKIADFGFARSLDPRNLAETMCGSPLYMAPEIMQLKKYDAKADLWSVGAILFQLVTGRPPFTGNNQIQLLQNIMKSTTLQFPSDNKDLSSDCIDLCKKLLRQDPVERLSFGEFFNHSFLSQRQPDESLSKSPRRNDPMRIAEERDHDVDFSELEGTSSYAQCRSSMTSTHRFCLHDIADTAERAKSIGSMDTASTCSSLAHKPKSTDFRNERSTLNADHRPFPRLSTVADSLELIVRDYVIVSSRPLDVSASSQTASVLSHLPCKLEKSQQGSGDVKSLSTAPIPNIGTSSRSLDSHDSVCLPCKLEKAQQASANVKSMSTAPIPNIGTSSRSLERHVSVRLPCKLEKAQQAFADFKSMSTAPMPNIGISCRSSESHGSVRSQGPMDASDAPLEQPSTNCMTRIKALQRCASAIKELVNEKVEGGRQLEAFSIQLVILAIRKQALHICHTQAVLAIEGSPTEHVVKLRESRTTMHDGGGESSRSAHIQGPQDLSSQIEKEFLAEVEIAEEFAKVIESGDTDMPDAMEAVYQSALALGKQGALDEFMGFTQNSAVVYKKAVRLFDFLLIEAPSLILNPPFTLTVADRYRLQSYIDAINNRESHARAQRMAVFKDEKGLASTQHDG